MREARGERCLPDTGFADRLTLFAAWCEVSGIELEHIQSRKPSQNGLIERFNGTYRNEILDAYLFDTLDEVREATAVWITEYNTIRPHESLGDVPPIEFLNQRGHARTSTYSWP